MPSITVTRALESKDADTSDLHRQRISKKKFFEKRYQTFNASLYSDGVPYFEKENNNLESCEKTNAVTMPRCACLTVICARISEQLKIQISPSTVPLQNEEDMVPKKLNYTHCSECTYTSTAVFVFKINTISFGQKNYVNRESKDCSHYYAVQFCCLWTIYFNTKIKSVQTASKLRIKRSLVSGDITRKRL